jgi:hypothetical protein
MKFQFLSTILHILKCGDCRRVTTPLDGKGNIEFIPSHCLAIAIFVECFQSQEKVVVVVGVVVVVVVGVILVIVQLL